MAVRLQGGRLPGSLPLCSLPAMNKASFEFSDTQSCRNRWLWKARRREKPPGEPRRRKEWTPARQGLVLGSWKGEQAPEQHLASFTRFYQPGKASRPPPPWHSVGFLLQKDPAARNPGYAKMLGIW